MSNVFTHHFKSALYAQGLMLGVLHARLPRMKPFSDKAAFKVLRDGIASITDTLGLVSSALVGPFGQCLTPVEAEALASSLFTLTAELGKLCLDRRTFPNTPHFVSNAGNEDEAKRLMGPVSNACSTVHDAIHYSPNCRSLWLSTFVDPKHPLTLKGATSRWRRLLGFTDENTLSWLSNAYCLEPELSQYRQTLAKCDQDDFDTLAAVTPSYLASELKSLRNRLDMLLLYPKMQFAWRAESQPDEEAGTASPGERVSKKVESLTFEVDLNSVFDGQELALLQRQNVEIPDVPKLVISGLGNASSTTVELLQSAALSWQCEQAAFLREALQPELDKAAAMENERRALVAQLEAMTPAQRQLLKELLASQEN